MTTAIVLLTNQPYEPQISFYAGLASSDYEIFVVVDDNAAELPSPASDVHYVRIDDRECRPLGFENLNPMISKWKPGKCSAWEKAIYYFSHVETRHDHVWFIEDDVLVTSPSAIQRIDSRYGAVDVISAEYFANHDGDLRQDDWWWWRCIPTLLPLPWARSMVCAVRVSRPVLNLVGEFVPRTKAALARENAPILPFSRFARKLRHKRALGQFMDFPRYLFIEYIFHTLALHNNATIVVAEELSGVCWVKPHSVDDMLPDRLYHPLKDRASHESFREQLAARS
jgi:glycosyltransferase involved in cell wall biosynthesis